MFLVQVNTIRTMWVLLYCSFDLVVTRTPFAASWGGGGGLGVLWSVHSSLHFFSFFALCDKPLFFFLKKTIKFIYLWHSFILQILFYTYTHLIKRLHAQERKAPYSMKSVFQNCFIFKSTNYILKIFDIISSNVLPKSLVQLAFPTLGPSSLFSGDL